MLKTSHSLPDIAIIRGGNKDFKQSLEEGLEVLKSLTKIGYRPIDIIVDKDGGWTLHGVPTEAHEIFTRAHTILDATHMKDEDYQTLAKKMGIKLLFSNTHEFSLDREGMYRVLRQKGIKVPDTFVVRSSMPIKDSMFRNLWSTYSVPILLRPLDRIKEASSKMVKTFLELEEAIKDYHSKGVDIHILNYKKSPTISVAVLPNFREEKLYMPIWVETFSSINNLPDINSRIHTHLYVPEFRKDQVKKYVSDVYDALDLKGPACIDMIPHNDSYVVVNVDISPSLRKDGRFMQSLATTGVEIGQYIHSQIKNELSR